MKKPQWYSAVIAAQGARVLGGKARRDEACAEISGAIHAHPEFIAGIVGAEAERELSAWLKANAIPAASAQLALFPDMPLRMRVAPAKYADVAEMDAGQLDHAKNMLWARTQNAMDGATAAAGHERAVFAAFYDKVRPLLNGDLTVADALDELVRKAA